MLTIIPTHSTYHLVPLASPSTHLAIFVPALVQLVLPHPFLGPTISLLIVPPLVLVLEHILLPTLPPSAFLPLASHPRMPSLLAPTKMSLPVLHFQPRLSKSSMLATIPPSCTLSSYSYHYMALSLVLF